jgi:hypothetical protein
MKNRRSPFSSPLCFLVAQASADVFLQIEKLPTDPDQI